MSSRRSRLTRKKSRNVPSQVEPLEARRLLTTLSGDGATFTYLDAEGELFRITLIGNITAEFVGGRVLGNNLVRLEDLVAPPPPDVDVDGIDLFAIYVTRSDAMAGISIVQVDDQGQPTPFGGARTIRVPDLQSPDLIEVSGGVGSGFLGAQTVDIEGTDADESGRPILFGRLPATGLGVIPPQPGDVMVPGITVVGGQNLGRFMFDGAVTGRVNFTGSVDTFYAGWLITGSSDGQSISAPQRPLNFRVNGDLRNLIVNGPIGTSPEAADDEPNYLSGFDMQVRGVVGQVRAASNVLGTMDVRNALGGPFMTGSQREIEYKAFVAQDQDFGWFQGLLGGHPLLNNDSFDNPQYLSSYSDPAFGGAKAARVAGEINLQTDPQDWYALPLLAGQTVTVQIVTPNGPGFSPNLAVLDPDQRVIATNLNATSSLETDSIAFTFTADRPGMYRFVVGDLAGVVSGDVIGTSTGTYSLRITGTGDIGFGAVSTDGNFLSVVPNSSAITVYRGDFGGLQADGNVLTSTLSTLGDNGTIVSKFGNVRSIEAAATAVLENNFVNLGLDLEVPFGNVGLVRATAADGVLGIVNDYATAGDGPGLASSAIGGSYQLIDAAGTFYGVLAAKRAIGTIRAGNMATLQPSIITVNSDNVGSDGIIDLIDVTGDLGTVTGGGPQITTNQGGNVRYMRVGGQIYRDILFGQGLGTEANTTTLRNGEEITITDDSGALINIRPRLIRNPNWNPADPTSPRYLGRPATFSVTTYPIRDGGSVITNIDTDRSIIISAVTSGAGRSAEIGRIRVTESGTPVSFAPPSATPGVPAVTDQLVVQPAPNSLDVSVFINGTTPVDVLEIQSDVGDAGSDTGTGNFGVSFAGGVLNGVLPGYLNTVQNTSGGEMPIIKAASIAALYGSTIGLAKPRATPAAVNPIEVIADGFPFQSQRTGVVAEDIINIAATEELGNIIVNQIAGVDPPVRAGELPAANSGTIGSIYANSDGKDVLDVYEGIVAPVVAHEFRYVDIGEGLTPSGSGQAQRSGIFANSRATGVGQSTFPGGGRIAAVRNRGRGDIRGSIVAEERIQSVHLTNGSIINAQIGVYSTIDQARAMQGFRTIPGSPDPINAPIWDIGSVVVQGNGGIIGSVISAADIQLVRVIDGFGIFTSDILTLSDGRIGHVIADGYGIRYGQIGDGGSVTEINATGNGQQVNSEGVSASVRLSEFGYRLDPFFGVAPNVLTDIHHVLGTTRNNRIIDNVTNSGIIEGLFSNGSRDLNALYAQRLRNSQFAFANRVDLIHTRGPMRAVDIISGRLGQLISGGNVAQLTTTISGPIDDIFINGNVDETSHIRAIGPSGRMGRLQVNGFLAGDVTSTGVINQLTVGRDILATSRIEADEIAVRHIGGEIFGQIVIT